MSKKSGKRRKWTKEEVCQWYRETGAVTYDNPEDRNVFVPNHRGTGSDVNWGNPLTYLLHIAAVAVILLLFYMSHNL